MRSTEERIFKLLEKRSGRKVTDIEKKHVKFLLESDTTKLPDFMGYATMDKLNEALNEIGSDN